MPTFNTSFIISIETYTHSALSRARLMKRHVELFVGGILRVGIHGYGVTPLKLEGTPLKLEGTPLKHPQSQGKQM